MAKKKKKVKARAKSKKIYTSIGVAILAVMAVVAVRYLRTGGDVAAAGNYFRGAENAAVVIEEFSDFR